LKPPVISPNIVEQALLSNRARDMGAAELIGPLSTAPQFAASIRRVLDEPGYRTAALRFSQAYQHFNPSTSIDQLAQVFPKTSVTEEPSIH
jgi:UDP:flavonoid glycosyltransferase YjiC (YdhE family)